MESKFEKWLYIWICWSLMSDLSYSQRVATNSADDITNTSGDYSDNDDKNKGITYNPTTGSKADDSIYNMKSKGRYKVKVIKHPDVENTTDSVTSYTTSNLQNETKTVTSEENITMDKITFPTQSTSEVTPETSTESGDASTTSFTTTISQLQQIAKRQLTDEEKLMHYLLDQYNPSGRPVLNGKDTVNVDMMFSLMHIKELDMTSQTLTTSGLLILEWFDERLTWLPAEHNGMREIIIEIAKLWQPEFAVINGADDIYEEYSQFRAVVSHNGLVHWEPGGVFKTMCQIDITYYPFDKQKCALKIGAWTYHTKKMNISSMSDTINKDAFRSNGEWNILHTLAYRDAFFFLQAPDEKYAFLSFEIYLERRHKYYILNVILPSLMTSVLLLSIFFSPPAQKVKIGVVVLLSYMIFLVNVSKSIPKTSDNLPMLGIYLTCILAMTTLSMVLTVFILNLNNTTDRPVPWWTRGRVFIGLARVIGMSHSADILAQKQEYVIDTDAIAMTEKVTPTQRKMLLQRTRKKSDDSSSEHETGKEDYSREWKQFAEILDRLFFWIFSLGIIISTALIFHPLM